MHLLSKILIAVFLVSGVLLAKEIYAWPSGDIQALTANIYYEARGESALGQLLVAQVTINRTKQEKWPSTIEEVVKQRKQFSWFDNLKRYSPKDKDAWKQAELIARIALENDIDFSDGAVYYHATYVKPKWTKKLTHIMTVGNHKFYR